MVATAAASKIPDHPPEHILSILTIDSSGWLADTSGGDETSAAGPVLIPSCKTLVDLLEPRPGEQCPSETERTSDEWISALRKVDDLYELVTTALNDIERMGAPAEKRKEGENRKDRRSMKARKIRQLEESQKMRRKRQEHTGGRKESEDKDNANPNGSDGDGAMDIDAGVEEGDAMDIDAEEDSDPENSCESTAVLSASARAQMTFNSLRVILSVLQPMMAHPRRTDPDLVMADGTKLGNIVGKRRCYLFGTHAYGTVTVKGFASLNKHLNEIVSCIADHRLCDRIKRDASVAKAQLLPSVFRPECDKVDGIIDQTLGIFIGDNDAAVRARAVAAKIDNALIAPLAYSDPRLRDRQRASITRLRRRLISAVHSRYRSAELTVYGSCLSGLTLGPSSDVDISLHLPEALRLTEGFNDGRISPERYEKKMKSIVFGVKHAIQDRGGGSFDELFAVTGARIPVVKGRYLDACSPHSADGSLCFDVCFLNDIAVANSSLLGEYSRLDHRVRKVMLAVKSWVKVNNIGSAADGTLSSYTWMVLVIFYLQVIDFVPNLQSVDLMKAHGLVPDPHSNPQHGVNGLNTAFLSSAALKKSHIWKRNKRVKGLPVTALMYGFFKFYAGIFPHAIATVSIRRADCSLLKTSFSRSAKLWRTCIEDPFETHFSHCPHDLGVHMDQKGQRRFQSCLRETVMRMEHSLRGNKCADEDAVMAVSKIVRGEDSDNILEPQNGRDTPFDKEQRNVRNQGTREPQTDGRGRNRHTKKLRRPEPITAKNAPQEQNRGGEPTKQTAGMNQIREKTRSRDRGRGRGRGHGHEQGHGRGSGRGGSRGRGGRGNGSA